MMEHGASESVEEQSLMELTINTEVEVAATSTVHIDSVIDLNHLKQEPGLAQSVKSRSVLVKEENLEDSSQHGNEHQCVQDASPLAGTGNMNEACSRSLSDLLNVKHELEDMDIGPTVLQHMDVHYTINKNMRDVTEGNTNEDDDNEAMPSNVGKKKSVENELRDKKYCCQTTTEDDFNDTHLESCLGSQKDLQRHLPHQHSTMSSSSFYCDTCHRTFHKLHLLRAHKKLHQQKNNKFSVTSSSAIAGPSNQSPDQTAKMTQKSFKCDVCEKTYSLKTKLNVHKRLHSGVGLSVCRICDAKFSRKSHLENHLRIHTGEKPYQCNICYARFAQSGALTIHMKIHTGEKPYQCDTCDASFTYSNVLTQHMRVHTGEKPYQCNMCDARFARSTDLTRHMRVHSGEKPYHCNICDARFAQSGNLTSHMRVHTGEKPYQCNTCDAKFTESSALSKHMRVHTGEKPYKCDACDARFARSGDLTGHMRVHIGEKPFVCGECGAKFVSKYNLFRHMTGCHI